MMLTGDQRQIDEERIEDGLWRLVHLCHGDAAKAGWWDGHDLTPGESLDPNVVGAKLALIHSEISEALEGYRKNLADDHLPNYPMFVVELADALIRIGDLVGALVQTGEVTSVALLGSALIDKLHYNAQRPDHKREARAAEGGKKI